MKPVLERAACLYLSEVKLPNKPFVLDLLDPLTRQFDDTVREELVTSDYIWRMQVVSGQLVPHSYLDYVFIIQCMETRI